MDDFSSDIEHKYMFSAFSKLNKINNTNKRNDSITIGPNSNRKNPPQQVKTLERQNPTSLDTDLRIVLNTTDVENGLPMRHILREFENQRQEECKSALGLRLKKIRDFTRSQDALTKVNQDRQFQSILRKERESEDLILDRLKEFDNKIVNDQNKLKQQFQDAAIRQHNQQLALEAKERQRQQLNGYLEQIKINQQGFKKTFQEIFSIMRVCKLDTELKECVQRNGWIQLMKDLTDEIENVIGQCRTGKFTNEEVVKSAETLAKIQELKNNIQTLMHALNTKYEESEKQKLQTPVAVEKIETKPINTQNVIDATNITKFVSTVNLAKYTELMEFLDQFTASLKDLEREANTKKFIAECKKAINIPVSALSDANSEHISDKYTRLFTLLSGQNVIVSDNLINASKHPKGVAFCMDLLSRKLVLQGDIMVSSKPESAFCYASVMVSLWNDFPVFGKLLLAYFYKACPYLVPYYIPRQADETDEQFYTKRGYQYKDGQIEEQVKFLKRMTGITRLYAALMIAKPKRGQTTRPFDITEGWRWLAAVLKLEQQEVTATVLHAFLNTVGFHMDVVYGKAFKKILVIIETKFLPICKEKCSEGPASRLEHLLEEYKKNGRFEKPNGYVEHALW